ncbi:MAG: hypothetical protein ACYSTY_03575 [Planctomycetota bacterium]|jgi:hypothetical protein
MVRRRSIWFPAAFCLAAAAPDSGASGASEEGRIDDNQPAPLQPVEEAVADRHALSVSLREVDGGLREPDDFSDVFPVPGHDHLFMRAQGSLHAVFPQSTYVRWRGVLLPLVPDNTVLYIGPPSDSDIAAWYGAAASKRTRQGEPQGTSTRISGRIETRVELRVAEQSESNGTQTASARRATRSATKRPGQPTARKASPAAPKEIATDTGYRGQRLGALVRRAAAAARSQAD